MNKIYTSHLDQDAYKAHMGSFFWHYYKGIPTEYAYKCRDPQINLLPIYDDLNDMIGLMSQVTLQKDEHKWLWENTRITQSYLVDFLDKFQFDPKQVTIKKINENPGLDIRVNGPIEEASLWEMPLMYTISELYFRKLYKDNYEEILEHAKADLFDSIKEIREIKNPVKFTFSEFGTRRRFSHNWQENVIIYLQSQLPNNIIGTSNMYFAKKHKLKAVGTIAHEAVMLYQSIVHPEDSQKKFMRDWIEFFRGWNGIALTDTLGDNKWKKDFTHDLMRDYAGQRHDSGSPYKWGKDRIADYEKAGIDTKEKTLLFSDNLCLGKAYDLSKEFGDKINVTHGIGTHLTNYIPSIPEHKALNQVIKLVRANNRPVAKLGNDIMKVTCENSIYLEYLKSICE